MTKARVLVADDERGVRALCRDLLVRDGHEVATADSAEAALALCEQSDFDVVLADVNMPGMDGIQLCHRLRQQDPEQIVILITGYPSIENAIRGIKEGARDYVTKPFTPDQLRLVLARALEERQLRHDNEQLRRELRAQHGLDRIIGGSPGMQQLRATARKVARSDVSVLVLGESGTGKELVARAIHVHSTRAARPFVAVNCGSLVSTLLESELFGHEKGAFTGALARKVGLATAADRGTLFLDEIGELAPEMQPKLLRLLQDGEVKPVGSLETHRVSVRVVAATNRDLRADVDAGRFREDLYYRLNVICLEIPPLRKRPTDIPSLATAFLRSSAAKAHKELAGITPAALSYLQQQPWPGNVRELQNAVERAVILGASDVLDVCDFDGSDSGGNPAAAAANAMPTRRVSVDAPYPFENLTLEEVERRHIDWVMAAVGGQKSRAAQVLGINRTTLWKKLRRYEEGEEGPDEPEETER